MGSNLGGLIATSRAVRGVSLLRGPIVNEKDDDLSRQARDKHNGKSQLKGIYASLGEFTAQEQTYYNHGKWPAEAVGAAYSSYLDQAVYEAMQREGLEDDFVMLGRATWAGSQRWGGALWSGDIHSHWAVLSQQFTAGLNAAMSGARCLFYCTFFLNVVFGSLGATS